MHRYHEENIRNIIRSILTESFDNDISDYEIGTMTDDTMERNSSADIIKQFKSIIDKRLSVYTPEISNRIISKMPQASVAALAQDRLERIKNHLESALINAFNVIKRRIRKGVDFVADPTQYEHEQSENVRRCAVASILRLIEEDNLLNMNPDILTTTRKFIEPKITDMVNELANKYIDGNGYRNQDRAAIKDMMRNPGGRSRSGKVDRGVYDHARTIMRG